MAENQGWRVGELHYRKTLIENGGRNRDDISIRTLSLLSAQFQGWESADEQIHIHVLTARPYVRAPNRYDCHLLVAINES